MKKTNYYLLLAACAFGAVAFATKLAAANNPTPACSLPFCTMPSCCSGMAMTTPMSDSKTNAVPALLKTCPVSGDKLGEMGKPYVFIYKGQEVKLCCSGCKKDFEQGSGEIHEIDSRGGQEE